MEQAAPDEVVRRYLEAEARLEPGVVTGSAPMAKHGLGWLGIAALLATVVFTMQRGLAAARYVRKQRA